jgi:hypothetical protein
VTGNTIYDPIDWETTAGIITPIGSLFVSLLIFVIVERLNRFKLRSQGYNKIVDVIEGKKK